MYQYGRRHHLRPIFELPLAIGAITLLGRNFIADGYVAVDGPICTGTTEFGCELRSIEVPTMDDTLVSQCVQYCPAEPIQAFIPTVNPNEIPPPPIVEVAPIKIAPPASCDLQFYIPGKSTSFAADIARVLVPSIERELGQKVFLNFAETESSAALMSRFARLPASGCNLLMASWLDQVIDPSIRRLGYDPLLDFSPVALGPINSFLVIVRKDYPVNSLEELVTRWQENPQEALIGVGTTNLSIPRLAALHLQSYLTIPFTQVPTTDVNDVVVSLNSGKITMFLGEASAWVAKAQRSEIKTLAIVAGRRHPGLPDIPTTEELNLSGFYASQWRGFWLPKDAAPEVIARVNMAIKKVFETPDIIDKLSRLKLETMPAELETPEMLRSFHESELVKWKQITLDAGLVQ